MHRIGARLFQAGEPAGVIIGDLVSPVGGGAAGQCHQRGGSES